MLPYIAEFVGTMMLIILGDGVVANVTLNKSGMKGAGSIQITIAWGLAVMLPAFIFGAASGAHFRKPVLLHRLLLRSVYGAAIPGALPAGLRRDVRQVYQVSRLRRHKNLYGAVGRLRIAVPLRRRKLPFGRGFGGKNSRSSIESGILYRFALCPFDRAKRASLSKRRLVKKRKPVVSTGFFISHSVDSESLIKSALPSI